MTNQQVRPFARRGLMLLGLALLLALSLHGVSDSFAQTGTTFTVTNTADSGAGSLRQAILDANANPGQDTIAFDIPGAGPHTIQPLTPLDSITDSVIVDGCSQPGADCSQWPPTLMIEIDGPQIVGMYWGLEVRADDTIVRGLIFNNNGAAGVRVIDASNGWLYSNFFGTDATGDNAANTISAGFGIIVEGAAYNTIIGTNGDGTNDAIERNLISGNPYGGIMIGYPIDQPFEPENTVIAGNFIGTDVTGTSAIANDMGIAVYFATNNLIGTNADGISDTLERNIISGNTRFGVVITEASASGNVIAGNYIGTDVSNTLGVGNGIHGIMFRAGAHDNRVGGSNPAEVNVITDNGGAGIAVGASSAETNNRLSRNSITGNQTLGIDLTLQLDEATNNWAGDGVTPNDPLDADTGPNTLQNYPVLTQATETTVTGTLNSTPNTTFTLEFFSNPICNASNYGDGVFYEETTTPATVTTDANGDVSFSFTFVNSVSVWHFITATATDPNGSTSEFSACMSVENPYGPLNPPSDLVATAQSSESIALQWTDNSEDETLFSITRSPNGSSNWEGIGSVPTNTTTYLDTSLVCGTTYYYHVSAYRAADGQYSTHSNAASATTSACPELTTIVTNTNDSGAGSLRQAILNANANPGQDTISFNIPGAGPHIIAPLTPLPNITDSVIIDGTTQPGASCDSWPPTLTIEISDPNATFNSILYFTADNNILRGMVINGVQKYSSIRFFASSSNHIYCNFIGTDVTGTQVKTSADHDGITISGEYNVIGTNGDGINDAVERNVITGHRENVMLSSDAADYNRVAGNFIGTDVNGTKRFTSVSKGIEISGGDYNTIGTNGDGISDDLERNIVSSNGGIGIEVGGDYNIIAGNYVGTDVTGTQPLGNGDEGIYIRRGIHNLIGTNSDGVSDDLERNIISANGADGIMVPFVDVSYNTIAGNYIGTDVTGINALGNANDGVFFYSSTNNVLVGNLIAYNSKGVVVYNNASGAHITQNRIVANNLLGIDLNNDWITPNDAGDSDTGSNGLQNYPVLTVATPTAVAGMLNSTPNTTFTLEFFSNTTCNSYGYGEGESFEDTTIPATVTTDVNGEVTFDFTFAVSVAQGRFITATATDPGGNTSEFSACVALVPRPAAPTGLTATAQSDSEIALQWTDNSNDETAFHIERSPDGTGDWTEIGTVSANVTTYTDTELTCSTAYSYRVRGYRASDDQYSAYSNVASATTGVCPATLDAPILLTPLHASIISVTPTFTWKAVAEALTYQLEIDNDADFTSLTQTSTGETTTYTATSLEEGSYYWRVRALGSAGSSGPWSVVYTFTARTTPRPALITPAEGSHTNDRTPTFDWEDMTDAMQYILLVCDDPHCGSPRISTYVTPSTFTNNLLPLADGVWYWQVRAQGWNLHWSDWSNTWSFTVDTVKPARPILTNPANAATIDENQPAFQWEALADAATYRIQIDRNQYFRSADLVEGYANTAQFIPGDPLMDGKWFWRVAATDAAGNVGAWSAVFNVFIDALPTPVPALIAPAHDTLSNSRVFAFAWSSEAGVKRYNIQVDNEDTFTAPYRINANPTANTFTNGALPLGSGVWYWRVRAQGTDNNWGAWSEAWTLTVDTEKPARPVLISPAMDETVTTSTPTFEWSAIGDAVSYVIQIDKNTYFRSADKHEYAIEGTNTTTIPDALYDGAWFWRVAAVDAAGNQSQWSANSRVLVDAIVTPVPTLIAPADDLLTGEGVLTFEWSAEAGVVRYNIQIDNEDTFTAPMRINGNANTNSFRNAALPLGNGTWYWRVRARGTDGIWGEFSPYRTIEVDRVKPSRPTLASPATGSSTTINTPTFTWNPVADADVTGYIIQIDKNYFFASPERIMVPVAGTSYTPDAPLANRRWFWRVAAVDAAGNVGPWSAYWHVIVAGEVSSTEAGTGGWLEGLTREQLIDLWKERNGR